MVSIRAKGASGRVRNCALRRHSSNSESAFESATMPLPMPISPLSAASTTVRMATLNCASPDGAGIDAARIRLELVDDLHGADLGRAGYRAAWEQRAEHVLEPHV